MKNKLLTILAAGTLLASNQFSLADCCFQDPCCPSNWYVAASGSVAWHNDHKFTDPENESKSTRDYDTGWGVNTSVGYIFDMCCCSQPWDIRLEAEYVFRRNPLDQFTLSGEGHTETESAIGHTQDSAIMANLIADVPLFCDLSLYAGGGIGASFNQLVMSSAGGVPRSPTKNTDTLFAWQILAGLSYCICPNLELTTGYRLFATSKVETPGGLKSQHIPITQSVDIGLRFRL